MNQRARLYTDMTTSEWDQFREQIQVWCYSLARSDVESDHPEGIRALDEAFNELCAHIHTLDSLSFTEDPRLSRLRSELGL